MGEPVGDALRAADPYELRKWKRRANRARNFPHNTCGSSRHVHLFVDSLLSKRRKHPIEECYEVEHIASSLLVVLACLWEARTELEALKKERAATEGGDG